MPCAEPPHLFHPTRGGARGLVKSVPRFEPQASCSPQPAPPLGAKRNWQQASDPGVLRRFRALAGKRNHPLFRPATALLGSEPARGTPESASAGQGRAGPGRAGQGRAGQGRARSLRRPPGPVRPLALLPRRSFRRCRCKSSSGLGFPPRLIAKPRHPGQDPGGAFGASANPERIAAARGLKSAARLAAEGCCLSSGA